MVSQVPAEIRTALESEGSFAIAGFEFSSGGCINNGGKLTTSAGTYFLKWNDAAKFPGMLEAEAKGLTALAKAEALRVPIVKVSQVVGQYQFLLMEWIGSSSKSGSYWEKFGERLAQQHQSTATQFGLDHDNYIGSLPQSNAWQSDWCDFFRARISAQVELAAGSGFIATRQRSLFERLYTRLPDLLPQERPALLHGDLWGGNLMTDEHGEPCVIDPAIYYGSGEADIAMTQLFGGFDNRYLEAYNSVRKLLPGYMERLELYKVYYLLVHVNLFGSGYVNPVLSIVNRFQ